MHGIGGKLMISGLVALVFSCGTIYPYNDVPLNWMDYSPRACYTTKYGVEVSANFDTQCPNKKNVEWVENYFEHNYGKVEGVKVIFINNPPESHLGGVLYYKRDNTPNYMLIWLRKGAFMWDGWGLSYAHELCHWMWLRDFRFADHEHKVKCYARSFMWQPSR